jgi:hypothetical protein
VKPPRLGFFQTPELKTEPNGEEIDISTSQSPRNEPDLSDKCWTTCSALIRFKSLGSTAVRGQFATFDRTKALVFISGGTSPGTTGVRFASINGPSLTSEKCQQQRYMGMHREMKEAANSSSRSKFASLR